MFVIVFPYSIHVAFRKLEDGLCALVGLNKLVFVSRGTGDCSCMQYHNTVCPAAAKSLYADVTSNRPADIQQFAKTVSFLSRGQTFCTTYWSSLI